MRPFLLCLPLLVTALAACGGGTNAHAKTAASPKRTVPLAVAFWDERHGLLALTSFRPCSAGEEVELERTSDGGRSWRPVRRSCASVTGWGGEVSLATAGAGTAWLAVPRGLLRRSDRGASWSLLPGPSVSSLSFSTPAVGWAVRGTILQETRDGGRTWRRLPGPCGRAVDAKVSLPRHGHGWIVCLSVPGAGNQGKAVYETRDDGRSWRLRARAPFGVRPVGRLDTYGYPIALVFRPAGRGWMPQGRGTTLVSRDGGRSWSHLAITAPEVRLGLSVSFVSDVSGFALVQDGGRRRYELERTTDGGLTWHVVRAWPTG